MTKPSKTDQIKALRVKKAAKKGAPKKAAPKAARAGHSAPNGSPAIRPGTKLEAIVGLLKRPEGCTTAQALAATGWPAISMPQQAKAAGITLLKEKVEGRTVYRAAA